MISRVVALILWPVVSIVAGVIAVRGHLLESLWHVLWHQRRSVLRAEIAYLREMLDRTNVDAQRLRIEWDNAYRANEDMTERYNIQRQETERLRMRLSGYEKYPGKTDATHCNTLAEEAAVKRAAGALP